MRRIAIISSILIFSAMLTPQTANASPECPIAPNNLGCIADFDPNPHGGGGVFGSFGAGFHPDRHDVYDLTVTRKKLHATL
jgi:hypothetical protein